MICGRARANGGEAFGEHLDDVAQLGVARREVLALELGKLERVLADAGKLAGELGRGAAAVQATRKARELAFELGRAAVVEIEHEGLHARQHRRGDVFERLHARPRRGQLDGQLAAFATLAQSGQQAHVGDIGRRLQTSRAATR